MPSARRADAANAASFAGVAAGAGFVRGLSSSNQVSAVEGQRKRILAFGGWEIVLDCGVEIPGAAFIELLNVSAGNDSHADENLFGSENNELNQGEEMLLGAKTTTRTPGENSAFSATGSNGSAVHGQTYAIREPTFNSSVDCVGSASVQGNLSSERRSRACIRARTSKTRSAAVGRTASRRFVWTLAAGWSRSLAAPAKSPVRTCSERLPSTGPAA